MKLSALFFAMICSTTSAFAQSLKIDAPTPLQSGLNKSTIDNVVGTQYWYFNGEPGPIHLHAQFTSIGLLGKPSGCQLTFTLNDEANTWHSTKVLSSDGKMVECTFDGDLKKPTKVLVTVAPPAAGAVLMGGSYVLESTGAVQFGHASTADAVIVPADPVIGTYKQAEGDSSELGDFKFLPDGTIETTSGAHGKWKLFDKATQIYTIDIDGQERRSLQFISGQGLSEGGTIIFQASQ
jgi:hypothetical protein